MKICYHIYFKHDISRKSALQLLLFFYCKKKQNYNAMVSRQNIRTRLLLFLLFDVNFFVLFSRENFDVSTIFSKLPELKKNALFMKIYIPMERSNFSVTKYTIIKLKRKRRKLSFN